MHASNWKKKPLKQLYRVVYKGPNWCMMAHDRQAVFVNDSYLKCEFHFHVQFEF